MTLHFTIPSLVTKGKEVLLNKAWTDGQTCRHSISSISPELCWGGGGGEVL